MFTAPVETAKVNARSELLYFPCGLGGISITLNACIIYVYMAIPESQLEVWSNQGAVTTSASTYAAIQRALDRHQWPSTMAQESFLQGSYANATNVRGNSDVDIVVVDTSLFYHNLDDQDFRRLGLTYGTHSYSDFRREVIAALVNHFGASAVDSSGSKAIRVKGDNNRLDADVLPACEFHNYQNSVYQGKGIAFFTNPQNERIVNYPKQHIENGQSKNANLRTSGRYKSSVRMFKNIREKIIGADASLRSAFPSYFVECLIYNVPDRCFQYSRTSTFLDSAGFLSDAFTSGTAKDFRTGSEWHVLFGHHSVQWSESDARVLVDKMIQYWNNY